MAPVNGASENPYASLVPQLTITPSRATDPYPFWRWGTVWATRSFRSTSLGDEASAAFRSYLETRTIRLPSRGWLPTSLGFRRLGFAGHARRSCRASCNR